VNASSRVSQPLAGRKRSYHELDWSVPPEWPVKRRRLTLSRGPEEDEIVLVPGLLSEKAKGKCRMTQEQMDEEERRENEMRMEYERQCELEAEAEERAKMMERDEALARKMQREYDDADERSLTPLPQVLESEQIANDSHHDEETQSEWDEQDEVEIDEEESQNHPAVESYFTVSDARDEK
jgi:hypothetical protein